MTLIESYDLAFESHSAMEQHNGFIWVNRLQLYRRQDHGHLEVLVADNDPNPVKEEWRYLWSQGIRGWVIVRTDDEHFKYILDDAFTEQIGTLTFDDPYADIWRYADGDNELTTTLRERPDILPHIMATYNKAADYMSHADAMGYAIDEVNI